MLGAMVVCVCCEIHCNCWEVVCPPRSSWRQLLGQRSRPPQQLGPTAAVGGGAVIGLDLGSLFLSSFEQPAMLPPSAFYT